MSCWVVWMLAEAGRVDSDRLAVALWVAAKHLDDIPAAIRACVDVGGDVDTTCAIVGGVVSAHAGVDGIPAEWLASREALPDWTPSRVAGGSDR